MGIRSPGGSIIPKDDRALCIVRMSATYADETFIINSGTDTPIIYDVNIYDPLGCHSVSVLPARIFVPAGYNAARCTSQFGFTGNSAVGFRRLSVERNDSVETGAGFSSTLANAVPSPTMVNVLSGWIPVNPGEFLGSFALQNSGGEVYAQAGYVWMQVEFANIPGLTRVT